MRTSSGVVVVVLAGFAGCVQAGGPPRAITHDNVLSAGHYAGDTLVVSLEVKEGRWFAEKERGRSEVVQAFAIEGGPPLIPGPLLRVRAGTPMRVRVVNPLDSTLIVAGLHTRPGSMADTAHVASHTARELRFDAGEPGTYFYWATTTGADIEKRLYHDSMLAGAFIIDAADAPAEPRDRVFVIDNWAAPVDTAGPQPWVQRDMMVLNGKSWPETERFSPRVGDTLVWRWVNPTANAHPMHLHGTYFTVTSRGTWAADTVYSPADERLAVTEMVLPGGTFAMRWAPERPGNWLFHCHFAFHISHFQSFALVPDPDDAAAPDGVDPSVMGMRGMILGITVRPAATAHYDDPRERTVARHSDAGRQASPARHAGPDPGAASAHERQIQLELSENDSLFDDEPGYLARVSPADASTALPSDARMGDPIIIRRGEPVAITVVNRTHVPTAIHWHGMQLRSHSDGVPGWSGLPGSIVQAIPPAGSFVARMDPPRAGTFIYHSHSNEGYQISAGIYGPLIVLEPGESWNPETDRPFVVGGNGRSTIPGRINGQLMPDTVRMVAGRDYRFRLIAINPDFRVDFALCRGSAARLVPASADPSDTAEPPSGAPPWIRELLRWTRPTPGMCELAQWRALAKDGADLPARHAVSGPAWIGMGPGETADYAFAPPPGDYTLVVVTQIPGWTLRVPIRVR